MSFCACFLGCLFGGGIALGYGARIFDKVETPKKEELIKKIQDISAISELKYADGSSISAIDSDLLRISVASKSISANVKKQSLLRKTKISTSIMGLLRKLFCGQH